MAISFPRSLPTSIGIAQISLRSVNAVAANESPFSFKPQVYSHPGEKWEATISLPKLRREHMAPWKAFLVSMRGQVGTFLLGDPDYVTPRGTVSSCVLTGDAGDSSVAVIMTGTLLEGDYIQLGSGASAKLHTVLQDLSGSGTLEIWPALRSSYTSEAAVLSNPRGVFKLRSNVTEWEVDSISKYGMSFEAMEFVV